MAAAMSLIDLNSQASWEFQFFPNELSTEDAANWESQDTTIGTKPLFYANREPRKLSFPELWLDNTDTGESLTPTLNDLKKFAMDEQEDRGMPAALLVTWGDRSERCVMERIRVEEKFWDESGNPLRATISLDLIELQPDGEGTGVHEGE